MTLYNKGNDKNSYTKISLNTFFVLRLSNIYFYIVKNTLIHIPKCDSVDLYPYNKCEINIKQIRIKCLKNRPCRLFRISAD